MVNRQSDPRNNKEYNTDEIHTHPVSPQYQEFLNLLANGSIEQLTAFKDNLTEDYDNICLGILNRTNSIQMNSEIPEQNLKHDHVLKRLDTVKKLKGRQIDRVNKRMGELNRAIKKEKAEKNLDAFNSQFVTVAKAVLPKDTFDMIVTLAQNKVNNT
jgi:hypothetical protein